MRICPYPTEWLAPSVFAAALGSALAAWAWLTVWEGMGYHAEWWVAVMAASVAAGAAFSLDANSTAKFGRRMIAECEQAPLLRLAARRYGVRSCLVLQAATEACLVVATPWLLAPMPAHHVLVSMLVCVTVAHGCGWRQNSRLWRECALD